VKTLFQFYEFIGAKGNLPEYHPKAEETPEQAEKNRTAQIRAHFEDLMFHLIENNPYIPADAPVGFVLFEFTTNVINGRFKRNGNNISALAECMNKNLESIKVQWWREKNKNQKALPAKTGKNIEKWSDTEVYSTFKTLVLLDHRGIKVQTLFNEEKPDNFFNRVAEEFAKRGFSIDEITITNDDLNEMYKNHWGNNTTHVDGDVYKQKEGSNG
jgi:hypothetical protein